MGDGNKFEQVSYEKHDDYFNAFSKGEEKHSHAQSWLQTDTVDYWRHERFFASLMPLLSVYSDAKWLTVGDGRYGNDARWLLNKGCRVVASDISGVLLKEAFDAGLLTSYSVENAEKLSFTDSQFDFILCKDSYHHFPRPMYALYELLRVASTGVVLIEPSDHQLAGRPFDRLSFFLSKTVRAWLGKPVDLSRDYEDLGNYVYRLSRREIEKVALGLDYPVVAFKGVNDFFHKGMLDERVAQNGKFLKLARIVIAIFDLLSRLKLRDARMLTAIIFKQEISEELKNALLKDGYEVVQLTRNPYR